VNCSKEDVQDCEAGYVVGVLKFRVVWGKEDDGHLNWQDGDNECRNEWFCHVGELLSCGLSPVRPVNCKWR